MRVPFYKYQATANDFIIINQSVVPYLQNADHHLISQLCDRRLGIGADGLMIIAPSDDADFKMVYYNADGHESTMCGNGGRAIAHLAYSLKLCGNECTFEAIDGLHEAKIEGNRVRLKMIDVPNFEKDGGAFVLDTGSPHYVQFEQGVETMDIVAKGRSIRNNDTYKAEGINVNFLERKDDHVNVRTYERGVEDETFSCGTGVTAAAIASVLEDRGPEGDHQIALKTKGGKLEVSFRKIGNSFDNVWLTGPAEHVFDGSIAI